MKICPKGKDQKSTRKAHKAAFIKQGLLRLNQAKCLDFGALSF